MAEYLSIPSGFNTAGGLEPVSNPTGVEVLQSPFEKACATWLSIEMISPAEATVLAPDFIDPDNIIAGLRFTWDVTMNAQAINSYFTLGKLEVGGWTFWKGT